jgi:hypothetical protein
MGRCNTPPPLPNAHRARVAHQRPRQERRGALQRRWCEARCRHVSACGLVNRIDVVRNRCRAHNFTMTLIRVTGSQLHAARVLVGLSREDLAERRRAVPALNSGALKRFHTSRDLFAPVPCRLTCLSASAERFSGDGVYALCGYAASTITNYRSGTRLHQLQVAMDLCWGPSHRRMPREHEQEPRSAKVLQWCAARLPTKARTHKSRPIAQPQLMSASPS